MKFVYTLNSSRNMVIQTLNSLKGLTRYVEKKDILFIINPYENNRYIKRLSKYGTIIKGSEYYTNLDLPKFKYKIEICDLDIDEFMFLDCDTIIHKDPRELFNINCDIYLRPESANWAIDKDIWRQNKKLAGVNENLLMYHDGVMIFKNNIHKKIKEDWLKYYNMYNIGDLELPIDSDRDVKRDNELALSLAIGKYNIKKMRKNHHSYGWQHILLMSDDIYIHHIGTDHNIDGYYKCLNDRVEKSIIKEYDLIIGDEFE